MCAAAAVAAVAGGGGLFNVRNTYGEGKEFPFIFSAPLNVINDVVLFNQILFDDGIIALLRHHAPGRWSY